MRAADLVRPGGTVVADGGDQLHVPSLGCVAKNVTGAPRVPEGAEVDDHVSHADLAQPLYGVFGGEGAHHFCQPVESLRPAPTVAVDQRSPVRG